AAVRIERHAVRHVGYGRRELGAAAETLIGAAPQTVVAAAAGRVEDRDHAVADAHAVDRRADRLDDADPAVADDAGARGRERVGPAALHCRLRRIGDEHLA